MQRISVLVLWFLFFMPLSLPVGQAATIGSDWQYLADDSKGKWKYFDFGRFQSPIPGENHEAWLEVSLLPTEPEKNTLLFSTDGQAVEVFVEGSKIYADGDFGSRFMGHGSKWHMVEIPAVTHSSMLLFHFYADYPRQLGVFKNFVVDTPNGQARRLFAMDLVYGLSLPVAVLLGMISLMYVFNRVAHRWLNVKLILLTFIMALWTVSLSNVRQFLWDVPVIWRFLENFLCYLLPVVANSLILEVLEEDLRPAIRRIIQGYALLAGGALFLEVTGHNGLLACRQLLYGALLGLQILVFQRMWESSQRGNIYVRFTLVPMVTMAGLGVLDAILLYSRFWQWHIYLLPLGIYACSTFVICMVREQIVRERELEAHAEVLNAEITATMEQVELDELTGCRNRGAFEDFIQQKSTVEKMFSLIMLDIDHFKEINDTYGHEAGDRVLAKFAELVRSDLQTEQEFFRWGGEEFVIYCPKYNGERARSLAEEIRRRVETYAFLSQRQITVSAGVAQWHVGTDSQIGIFRRMDDALYAAKCNGRNQVVVE
ncbi:MAG: GGDEF domain-containing protein [Selenomonas sp.]|uniref:GGDEF domain-containing protein n=1 Tax=Selenomonas sp. TaxID=2053611 RepID=UPI0025DB149A|nr:GGDEF domain-containing protein [Selenomonas sp.]MCR5758678.1 GGDEF domain-containing protein [Selenomonas sp.]